MTSYAAALTQAAAIRDALDTAGLPALVDIDHREIAASVSDGVISVLVAPPKIKQITPRHREYAWSVIVIAATREALDAWDSLDPYITALVPLVESADIQFTAYQPAHGETWPCVLIEFTTTTLNI